MLEEVQNELKQLRKTLDKLLEIRVEDLVRTKELGTTFNFEKGQPIFERTLRLFRDLSECNFDNFPVRILTQLKTSANAALALLVQVKGFNIDAQPNPRQARDELIKKVDNEHYNQFATLHPAIAYSVRKGTDFAKLEREGRETLDTQKKIIADLETRSTEIIDKMNVALQKVQQVAAKAGVAQHAVHFAEESSGHKKSGVKWLVVSGLLALGTVLFAWFFLRDFSAIQLPGKDVPREVASGHMIYQMIRLTLSRVLIISILSYAVVWSGRNFLAHKHNEVVNRHRQNALSTFEAFVKATDDHDTKNAVLLEATHCIFTPQKSGYLSKESEPSSGKGFVEILRQIAPAEKGAE